MDDDYDWDDGPWRRPFCYERHGDRVLEYFRVNVPADVFDATHPDYVQQMDNQAIHQAREDSVTWAIPANWWVDHWEYDDAIVVRQRRKGDNDV